MNKTESDTHIFIDELRLTMKKEGKDIRLLFEDSSMLFGNQEKDNLETIFNTNYQQLYAHLFTKGQGKITNDDIKKLTLTIVLSYAHMYNQWLQWYPKYKNFSLSFKHDDFTHPNTERDIVKYFKNRYPDSWTEPCKILLEMDDEAFMTFLQRMSDHENR